MQALTCSFSSLRLGPVRCQQVKSHSCIAQRTSVLTVQKHSLRGCALRTEAPIHVQKQRSEAPVTVCKLKTRKAASKRYKVTGTGKVLTRRPGKQHINEKKSPKRLKSLGKLKGVAHGDMIKVKKCLPYAGI